MELEAIGRVSVGNLRFEVRWQIDDVDRPKRTFLWANTASNAESLGDECNFGFRGYLDAEAPASNHGAGFLALLSAFLYEFT
jgi:hypothetical protein